MTPSVCLAIAIYFEARGEPLEGQVAVAQVILNRVVSKKREFAKKFDVCSVIKKDRAFTFVPEDKELRVPRQSPSWTQSQQVAQAVMDGYTEDHISSDTYFYANVSKTDRLAWTKGLEEYTKIGNHTFWRYP